MWKYSIYKEEASTYSTGESTGNLISDATINVATRISDGRGKLYVWSASRNKFIELGSPGDHNPYYKSPFRITNWIKDDWNDYTGWYWKLLTIIEWLCGTAVLILICIIVYNLILYIRN